MRLVPMEDKRSPRTSTSWQREGIRFDFAHAHAVLTRPSHASILTGLYPYEHGVRDHSGYRMKAGTATIATVLKHAGFATGAFVGGVPVAKQFGLGEGFDVYDDRFGRTGNNSDFSLAERPAGEVIAPALTWIRAQPGRWFAWVHLFDPHAPYAPPPPFDREYVQKPYLGEVAYVDQALRPLIDTVRGSARPTLVLVTSDHGEGLGDHGELTHGLFAYEIDPARADDPGAVVRPQVARHRVARAGASHRCHPDPARCRGRAGAGRPPAVDRSCRIAPQPAAADVSSYFEAMSAMLNRGWAPLQGVIGGREKYIELPHAGAVRPGCGSAGADRISIERRADRRRALDARLREFHAAPPGERFSESPEVAATAAVARVHLRQRATEGAVHRAGRSEESDRAGSVDPAGHRGLAARPRIGGIAAPTGASSNAGRRWPSAIGTLRCCSGRAAMRKARFARSSGPSGRTLSNLE